MKLVAMIDNGGRNTAITKNQAVPLYVSEMAPAKWRGGLNILFQLAYTIGILIANLVNYGADKIANNGLRFALGLAVAPALLLTLGGLLLPDTPMSLITRGNEPQGRKVLEKLRGTSDVDVEFRDAVSVNLLFTFLIGQCFRPMLSGLKWEIFIFFAVWVAVMQVFVWFFLPETKGVPIERMEQVWRGLWFWKRFMGDEVEANV